MNLILRHLIKDIRAQRWLLLLWAFFILVYLGAEWLVLQPSYFIAHLGEAVLDSPLLLIGASVVWMLLLVGLIQSEPVIGSTSFWLTRPVPRWVFIPSKLTFIVVFLIVPWLALTPCEMRLMHVEPALYRQMILPTLWTMSLTIVVLWLATFTSSLGRFIVAAAVFTAAAAIVFGGHQIDGLYRLTAGGYGIVATQTSLLVYILLAGLVISMLVQQFVRKTRMGLRIANGFIVVAVLAGFFWPVIMPYRYTLLGLVPTANTKAVALKNARVLFAQDWPASLMWSQPNQPNGASNTVAVANGATTNTTAAKPISTTDDEGNPIIIGALVASAKLVPVNASSTEIPMIEGVESSFKPTDCPSHELPRRDSDVFTDKSTQFDLAGAVQASLPGITVTSSTPAATTLFKMDAENLNLLRGKTGALTLRIYGHVHSLSRPMAIPLDGDAFSRVPNGVVHAYLTTRQTQSIFGIDLPMATKDKPMLAVWQVAYQPALSLFQNENYYVLVDTATNTGVVLTSASVFPHHAAASFSSRASWTDYLTLPFDASDRAALSHKVLYVYTSTPGPFFNATLPAPGFTMSPP